MVSFATGCITFHCGLAFAGDTFKNDGVNCTCCAGLNPTGTVAVVGVVETRIPVSIETIAVAGLLVVRIRCRGKRDRRYRIRKIRQSRRGVRQHVARRCRRRRPGPNRPRSSLQLVPAVASADRYLLRSRCLRCRRWGVHIRAGPLRKSSSSSRSPWPRRSAPFRRSRLPCSVTLVTATVFGLELPHPLLPQHHSR